jgi:hypothetical protein
MFCIAFFAELLVCCKSFGFRWIRRVSGIGFGFGDEFLPDSVFRADPGFDFGFQF